MTRSRQNLLDEIAEKRDTPTQLTDDCFQLLSEPIGLATFNSEYKPKKGKKKWSDRVECEICGREYTRSAKSKHYKTQYHIAYTEMNEKIKRLLKNN